MSEQTDLRFGMQEYLAAGLCVLPAVRREKRPTVSWKKYQSRLPTPSEIDNWFVTCRPDAVCIVAGSVSGNLELIDFDLGGERFEDWAARIPDELLTRLFIETSQSGGRHVVYRCQETVGGNIKLAQRQTDDGIVTMIETRGEGGLFLCAPTTGYEIIQGDLGNLPVLSSDERETLLLAAWELNEHWVTSPQSRSCGDSPPPCEITRPGDDFNARGDVVALLEKHGWRACGKRSDGNLHWTRPGKTRGTSATLKDRTFYVFSSNAAPFEPNTAYSPFAILTLLEHGCNYEAAATALRAEGYGELAASLSDGVDLSQFHSGLGCREPSPPRQTDPGPIPESLCRVPGFVSEIMDHCLATAPYPNVPLAFCGALALQALLAGRKVRDEADNRTNIYLLALAFSAVGKDWPRKLNAAVLHQIGMVSALGEKFASGEGIQDSLFTTPAMLFQTDEIDGILQSINKSKDGRHESLMTTLLTMYSSANTIYPMRRKAGREHPGVIDQPHLVLYGTAIPTHYYGALSERMLTNGFMARMLVLESGRRSVGQDPGIIDPPDQVIETAQWWADYRPGSGNLEDWHPEPRIVPATHHARSFLKDARLEAEAEYTRCESKNDAVGTTVWGRVHEQTRKLALLYAVSASHTDSEITSEAAEWAHTLVTHQTRRMLFMAEGYVSDGDFDANCKKAVRILTEWRNKHGPDALIVPWRFRQRMNLRPQEFKDVMFELEQRQIAHHLTLPGKTKPSIGYRLKQER